MFGGKAPLRLAAQKSRLHAQVKSSEYYSQSKEPNPQQAEQGHAQMQQFE
jgi:hypothetical protein